MSTLSFHATKTYNTIEGRALICNDAETIKRIDYLKNFGFAHEITVVGPGINGKMDEVRSAYGLLGLKYIDAAIEYRRQVDVKYWENLMGVKGISFLADIPEIRHNYSYFSIFIDAELYGMTGDELYAKSHFHISAFCALYGSQSIVMEDYTGLSPRCTIFSATDDFSGNYLLEPMVDESFTNVTEGEVLIKKYSQIGTSCVIMPNLVIEEGGCSGFFVFCK